MKSKNELVKELFYKMDNEGVSYFFTEFYGTDDKKLLKKLGYDTKQIDKAVENLKYLDSIYYDLEEMIEN